MSRSIKARQAAEESLDQGKLERATSLATMMVYVDGEHESEPRLQLALGLAERFGSTLIGISGSVTSRKASHKAGQVGSLPA